MKKIVDFRQCVSFDNGKTFQDTSIWKHLRYKEAEEEKIEVLETFEQAYDFIKRNGLMNATIGTTLFLGHRKISISTVELECQKSFTKKNYSPIVVKSFYKEEKGSTPINKLANMLPAEDFCEWLKDRGITKI